MGRILHGKFRKAAEEILKKYEEFFTGDYYKNRKILEEVSNIPSKRLRNLIAGYITRKINKLQVS
ncbi:30S ribosomal protein S17e [Nanoarchaeota archaeon NZ13-N]|uniref:Small ribosomal subunit protein eS17 n=1 Tax=Candidatus Nanoclepta minutus TaxID=1940235 RepID=A0A397WML5_9ARCH|nr:MAG: 30S ribosomal protein S17e [Nanoarchaeota archaeon NZ13-N]RIB35288.1 MAG: 30S ribosomal protein S17e [Candidatus Nanoclepta minutus]